MRAGEGFLFADIAADTAVFALAKGGNYGVDVIGTGFGTVTLERQAGDGTTFVPVLTPFADVGYDHVYLPPGNYKIAVDTATAVYVQIVRIPGE